MTNQTAMKRMAQVQSTDFHRPISAAGSGTVRRMEHIRPELRDGLALLESRGLLAIGVQAILREAGFRAGESRGHCGCPACARRCAVCASRQ
jgi:hypothetical protein